MASTTTVNTKRRIRRIKTPVLPQQDAEETAEAAGAAAMAKAEASRIDTPPGNHDDRKLTFTRQFRLGNQAIELGGGARVDWDAENSAAGAFELCLVVNALAICVDTVATRG